VSDVNARLERLADRGVVVVDPRQTWVGPEVEVARVGEGVVLHPGARVTGAGTWLGRGAQVGPQGPATLVNAVLGSGATVNSGFVDSAVLLTGASAGANAHLRPGTLLEEQASTGHAVGLKQTILLSFVTLGSLINFCDALMAGGTSRRDHSEVGSGFIHFNFTPWGKSGDKATPSLIGDVSRGVFLRERRIFLGGAGGLVGPRAVGYGSVAAAGQVLRRDVPANHLVSESSPRLRRELDHRRLDGAQPRAEKNRHFIAQLVALRAWYRHVRLARADDERRPVIEAAISLLDGAVAERVKRLSAFLDERGRAMPDLALDADVDASPPPLPMEANADEGHVDWVRSLDEAQVAAGVEWLGRIAAQITGD
jgi:UDP-N-acetylglucosamine/UDP-N-acetylgalactosamine diphosphorylase